MQYLAATPKKLSLIALMFSVLALFIFLTFSFKETHFGSERLPNVVGRVAVQAGEEGYYRFRFGGSAFVGAALASFSGTVSDTYKNRNAHAVPVLLYHGLREHAGDYAISKERFAAHMEALRNAGWRTISLGEFDAFVRGAQTLPERSFLLTFDDGAKESYYPVDPILAALDMTAVSFILPKYSSEGGTHYYLSSGEIGAMMESGRWEIGSHGQDSHEIVPISDGGEEGAYLANLLFLQEEGRIETNDEYAARVERDLTISKENLERVFGAKIDAFAFPFGEFGNLSNNLSDAETLVRRIAEKIYRTSFYQTWIGGGYSFNYPQPGFDGMIFAKRIEPTPSTTAKDLVETLERGLPKDLPFEDDFAKERGWFSVWGEYEHTDGVLRLNSAPKQSGNAVVLDGTGHWKNYRVRAVVESPNGTGIFMWARFVDNNNNAGCNFGDGFIHAEEILDGVRNVDAGERGDDISIPPGDVTVEAYVEDRTLRCVLNGTHEVETRFLDPSLAEGGVGFKAWKPELGEANLIVKHLSVEPL